MIDQASRYGHEHLFPQRLLAVLALVCALAAPGLGWAQSAAAPGEESAETVVNPAPAESRELEPRLTTDQWRGEMRRSSARFINARSRYHQSFLPGLDLEARQKLRDEAVGFDPDFDSIYLTRARTMVRSGDPQGLTALVDWAQRLITGYRQQSRLAANALIIVDIILAGLLLWVIASLVLRYLPFFHHQLAARLDAGGHTKRKHVLLWVPVITPFLIGAGLVPTLSLLLPLIWMYTQRRARVVLGLLVGWFALQGVWPQPFGAVLVTLDSQSTTSLSVRAAQDPPGRALLADIDRALVERPQDADLHAARGMALARDGQFEASTTSYLTSLELHSDNPLVMNNVASNHFYLGNIDRAVSGYQQATQLDPTLGAVYHNLSQAYIRKLFFKEGGQATQLALQNGFSAERRPEALPRGAVYYEANPAAGTWALAWRERGRVAPYHLLQPLVMWLGTPVDHAGFWLLGSLLLSMLLGRVAHRSRLVFECANCADLACGSCHGEHEGAILCLACAANAKRARSEVVLRTLLRNRRHEAEGRYAKRIRGLSGLLFGLGHIYDGVQSRGITRGLLLVSLVVGALHPQPFVPDVWDPIPTSTWSVVRLVCLAGILGLALVSWVGRFPLKSRRLHLHPSNLVSLVDLMEGRPRRKASA